MKRIVLLSYLIVLVLSAYVYAGPLEEYVVTGSNDYSWKLTSQTKLPNGVDAYFLDLYSGTWQGIQWNHRLRVLVPPGQPTGVILFITGSGSGTEELAWFSEAAVLTGQIAAILHDVPNQPLFGGMREDELLAFTWLQFLNTGDPTWICHLPMTNAAARAMDAVDEFILERLGRQPNGYMVCGASKRGWTTWLVAAVDERVIGIAPMVYDNLNIPAQMAHQVAVWGDFSYKIGDYTSLGLHEVLGTPMGQVLVDIVDPYAYREKITMPKLLFMGSNDPYWAVDAVHHYLYDLVGDTYLYYVANGGHDLGGDPRVIIPTLVAFCRNVFQGDLPLPQLTWEVTEDGNEIYFQVQADQPVKAARFWLALSPFKDFRTATWTSVDAREINYNQVQHKFLKFKDPLAVYGELVFETPLGSYSLCTPVYVFE